VAEKSKILTELDFLAALPLIPGQKVRLLAGPFLDHIGTLLYLVAKDRTHLLLSLLSGGWRRSPEAAFGGADGAPRCVKRLDASSPEPG
jgi:hypothetical protein